MLYIASSAGASLLASGKTSGFYFKCGTSTSWCVAVYEGHTVPHTLKFSFVGGQDVTDKLMVLLNTERGCSFSTVADHNNIVSQITEKLCYVALDFEKETQMAASNLSLKKSYQLPDGEMVTLGSERFRSPEVLFKPNIIDECYDDYRHSSIQQVMYKSAMKYDKDAQSASVLVCGGSTKLPGFLDRLSKELASLVPPTMKVNLSSPLQGGNTAWVGGSILASLPTFPSMAISKEEYDEFGPAIVDLKCF